MISPQPPVKEMASLLEKWTNINSHTENLSGLETFLHEVRRAFAALLPDEMQVISLNHNRKGLFLKKRGDAPFQIFFGGHLDTVFSIEHPFQKACYLSAERLNGPGSADMKGGLVVLLKALEQFEKMEGHEKIGWEIFLNPDEEIGSPDSTHFLEGCAKRCQLACIFEPRLEDGLFVSQRKGSSNYKITSKGVKAHAGRNFTEGKNAIFPLVHFIEGIHQLIDLKKGIFITVGVIKGGEATNIIPDYAECQINVRTDTSEDMESVDLHFKELAQTYNVSCLRTSHRPPKPFDSRTEDYFQILKACGSELGLAVAWRASGGVCDGNTFAARGVPTLDTLGVRGGKIHTEHEFVDLTSLPEQAMLVALFLTTLAKEIP